MKIAYFSTEYPPLIYGGLGVYADNISRELALLGQRVSVFVWGDGRAKKYEDLNGVEVFRETPVPMRDGLLIFFSSQTRAWGENARKRVLERFTWERAAEQTLAIYEEVVARRS